MFYSTRHIVNLYGVSDTTVRKWVHEFREYLSGNATPSKGSHRAFNAADMGVISLIATMRQQNASFDDIHAALNAGQRGGVPEADARTLEKFAPERRVALLEDHNRQLQAELTLWEKKYEELQSKVGPLESENTELRARLAEVRSQLERIQTQLDNSQDKTLEAYRKGYQDASKAN